MKNILSIILIALSFSAFGQNRLSDRVGEASTSEPNEVILGSGTDGDITISTPWNTLFFNDYEYVDFFVEEFTTPGSANNRDRGYTRVTAEWLSVVSGDVRTIDMTNGPVNSNSIVSVSIPINGESGTTASITVGSNWGSDNYTWRVVGVKSQKTIVMPDALDVEDMGEHKFTATANNASNFPGSIAAITFDNYTDVVSSGSVATFDGTDIVVTAGTYDVELTALIHTDGSTSHNGIIYFRDASEAIGLKFGDGAVTSAVSSRGEYGEGSNNSLATATVRAGTTVTLNVVHSVSANSQNLEAGSYIHVKEIRGRSSVVGEKNSYTATEQETDRTWIDGKQIYSQVVSATLGNATTVYTSLKQADGTTDIPTTGYLDQVISIKFIASETSGDNNYSNHDTWEVGVSDNASAKRAFHIATADWTGYTGTWIVEYTKQ